MAVVTTRKTALNCVNSTIVVASILQHSKAIIYRFHHQNMGKIIRCELLYSDTDSLTYAIDFEDLYAELARAEVNTEMDFSNYPSDNALYNTENQLVSLKSKDKLAGVVF